jgi:hypothetical protein
MVASRKHALEEKVVSGGTAANKRVHKKVPGFDAFSVSFPVEVLLGFLFSSE